MILLAQGTECLFQYGVPFTIKSRLFISKIVSFFFIYSNPLIYSVQKEMQIFRFHFFFFFINIKYFQKLNFSKDLPFL